ncbi:MAG: hypothetical protein QM733_20570 [Ilumatobacteraceae bacterium]
MPKRVGLPNERGRQISIQAVTKPPEVIAEGLTRVLVGIATRHPEVLDDLSDLTQPVRK